MNPEKPSQNNQGLLGTTSLFINYFKFVLHLTDYILLMQPYHKFRANISWVSFLSGLLHKADIRYQKTISDFMNKGSLQSPLHLAAGGDIDSCLKGSGYKLIYYTDNLTPWFFL